ncbi:hypothetical protein KBY65_13420, partial [Cyanobium sp. Alchichica 3B3-8F6]|uniref:hypothetical protein n=1 Tax=Cyanobium sp. Alchichica 3B3-8F6 TaxID=2823696 RepID=UPI0020CD41AE
MKRRRWHALAAALLALWLALVPQVTVAGQVLEVFVRQGCPHCATAAPRQAGAAAANSHSSRREAENSPGDCRPATTWRRWKQAP